MHPNIFVGKQKKRCFGQNLFYRFNLIYVANLIVVSQTLSHIMISLHQHLECTNIMLYIFHYSYQFKIVRHPYAGTSILNMYIEGLQGSIKLQGWVEKCSDNVIAHNVLKQYLISRLHIMVISSILYSLYTTLWSHVTEKFSLFFVQSLVLYSNIISKSNIKSLFFYILRIFSLFILNYVSD